MSRVRSPGWGTPGLAAWQMRRASGQGLQGPRGTTSRRNVPFLLPSTPPPPHASLSRRKVGGALWAGELLYCQLFAASRTSHSPISNLHFPDLLEIHAPPWASGLQGRRCGCPHQGPPGGGWGWQQTLAPTSHLVPAQPGRGATRIKGAGGAGPWHP